MSAFTFNIYLVQDIDGDGTDDYVLQDEGRIVLQTLSITVDPSYRYIGGQIARKVGSNPGFTFAIKKRDDDTWYMYVNQHTFCGFYPSQDACLGILYGYYTSNDGRDDGFAAWLADSLEKGSVLDPDVNVLVIEVAGVDPNQTLGARVSDIDYSVAPTAGEFWFAYQNSLDSGSSWGVNGTSAYILGDRVTNPTGTFQIDTPSTTTYDAFAENSLMRGILVERILTGALGSATTGAYAAGILWNAPVSGLPAATWNITSLSGDVAAGKLTITFGDTAARDTFLADSEYMELNGNTGATVLTSAFSIATANSVEATGGNAATLVSEIDALGAAATWDVDVVNYGNENIVGISSNKILKDDIPAVAASFSPSPVDVDTDPSTTLTITGELTSATVTVTYTA